MELERKILLGPTITFFVRAAGVAAAVWKITPDWAHQSKSSYRYELHRMTRGSAHHGTMCRWIGGRCIAIDVPDPDIRDIFDTFWRDFVSLEPTYENLWQLLEEDVRRLVKTVEEE